MTMLNRLANQRFPTTAMTTGAPGVNAMPLAAPAPELRAKREAEYQPELMSHIELLRRNPGMMKIGEMPGSMGDLASVTKMLMRLDRVNPQALRFVRELFGQPGPGVRPGRDMADIISKAAPSAELRGGTLGVDEADVDPLVELLEGMGAPEGIAKGLKTKRGGNVRSELVDMGMVNNASRSTLPISIGSGDTGIRQPVLASKKIGMERTASGLPRFNNPSDFTAAMQTPTFMVPGRPGTNQVLAGSAIMPHEASDEFIEFLRARTPSPAMQRGTNLDPPSIESIDQLRNIILEAMQGAQLPPRQRFNIGRMTDHMSTQELASEFTVEQLDHLRNIVPFPAHRANVDNAWQLAMQRLIRD